MTTPIPETPGPDHRADTPNRWVPSAAARRYIYGGVAAVLALLVVLGIITQEQIAEWAQLTVALVAMGTTVLAAVNTPQE